MSGTDCCELRALDIADVAVQVESDAAAVDACLSSGEQRFSIGFSVGVQADFSLLLQHIALA